MISVLVFTHLLYFFRPVDNCGSQAQDQVSAIVEIEVYNDFASEPSINRFCSTEAIAVSIFIVNKLFNYEN